MRESLHDGYMVNEWRVVVRLAAARQKCTYVQYYRIAMAHLQECFLSQGGWNYGGRFRAHER